MLRLPSLRKPVQASATPKTLCPPGHLYSPIVDVEELRSHQARGWPAQPTVLGIDFNSAYHDQVLREYFPAFYAHFAYPQQSAGDPSA